MRPISQPESARRALSAACGGLLAAAAMAVGLATLFGHVTFNATPSLPRGLYLLRPARWPVRGDLVDFPVPASMAPLVATRGYLPASFHLLKRLVGVAGDRVCIGDQSVIVDETVISRIAHEDSLGRPLPAPYRMCGIVPTGMGIVATAAPTSLDSRFFGPVALALLTPATPLWTSSSP